RGRPGHPDLRRRGLVRRPRRRRRRQRRGDVGAQRGPPPPHRPVRVRPLLRAGHLGRRGRPARLLHREALRLMVPGLLAAQNAAPAFDVLTALVLVPAVGALLVALVPRTRSELLRGVAMASAAATGALALWLLGAFEVGEAGHQFETNREWISDFGIAWHVGVDGISLFLVVLTALLFPIAILGATPAHDPKPYYAWLLLLEAGCLGVFVALDLFMFFVMFEIVLVPMDVVSGGWGCGHRLSAALNCFLFTMRGAICRAAGLVARRLRHRAAVGGANRPERQALRAQLEGEQPTPAEEARIAELE